jgi:hypothetical protein
VTLLPIQDTKEDSFKLIEDVIDTYSQRSALVMRGLDDKGIVADVK